MIYSKTLNIVIVNCCLLKINGLNCLLSGRYHDYAERARFNPGRRQPCLRPLQPQEKRRAEHSAARRSSVPLRSALAHPGQAQPREWLVQYATSECKAFVGGSSSESN